MTVCTCWHPPINHVRCHRSLYHTSYGIMSTCHLCCQCRQRSGTWVVIPLNLSRAGRAVEQYVGEIKGGLRPAMKLTVIGMVHSNPKSFSVTLLCDPVDANKDVGLLFTVNFSDKSITRNARIAGKWGREEKTIPYFPFTAGDTFKMELLCEHQQIRVLLDGRQLCDFTHRIQPLNLVKALQISGDIKLTKVA
ncbi:galectin-related protein A-like isoform X1 [Grus americana]|uniref:galectin-related protein A-like isoform X1 n=2 Tax=Neoaves TaxID=3078114 RepID=UPI002408225A|nr:galectin-related protein A-like isoform X1 [Grus americana]XP_054681942.1 galectin-related protein A-like isoform X1 [Grus americana]